MKTTVLIFAVLSTLSTAASASSDWPPETLTYRPSELPGYALVRQHCLTCHSAHYVAYQPPSPRAYWDATVKKMKNTFGAPLDDKDIPAMVDYLTETYGAPSK
jgi:sulfite dehydrogenase